MTPASFTAPFHSKFNNHDIFAVIMPGFLALIGCFLMMAIQGHTNSFRLLWKEYLALPPEQAVFVTISVSLGSLIMSHAVGEILQIFGQTFEAIHWHLYGCKPFFWILNTDKSTSEKIKIRGKYKFYASRFLPASTTKNIFLYIKEDSSIDITDINISVIDSYYPRIKATTYHNPTYKMLCEQLTLKSHMYRGYLALSCFAGTNTFLLFIIATIEGNIYPIIATAHFTFIMIFGVIVLSRKIAQFHIEYNRFLYEGFLHEIKRSSSKQVLPLIAHYPINGSQSMAKTSVGNQSFFRRLREYILPSRKD